MRSARPGPTTQRAQLSRATITTAACKELPAFLLATLGAACVPADAVPDDALVAWLGQTNAQAVASCAGLRPLTLPWDEPNFPELGGPVPRAIRVPDGSGVALHGGRQGIAGEWRSMSDGCGPATPRRDWRTDAFYADPKGVVHMVRFVLEGTEVLTVPLCDCHGCGGCGVAPREWDEQRRYVVPAGTVVGPVLEVAYSGVAVAGHEPARCANRAACRPPP